VRLAKSTVHASGLAIVILLFLLSAFNAAAEAQTQSSSETDQVDAATVRSMLKRIMELEAEVKDLKAARTEQAGGDNAVTKPVQSQDAYAAASPDITTSNPQILEARRGMQFRGFGDVDLQAGKSSQSNGFQLGIFNLLMTSRLSDNVGFLGELVMDVDSTGMFQVEPERALLSYTPNDYFHANLGRYHTGIGYYNNAYHHGAAFLQTATGRPLLFAFDDQGGVLPIHKIGLSLTGRIPSGALGLTYIAEVGFGPSSHMGMGMSGSNQMMTVTDDHNGRAFNLGLIARPLPWHPVQFGFDAYHADRTPMGMPSFSENIYAGHFLYLAPSFEFLNEVALIRHSSAMMGTFNTLGFYSQLSRKWHAWRPFVRYNYLNAPEMEPIFTITGRQNGPSGGLRYEVNESVALKLQFDHLDRRGLSAVNVATMQTSFVF
jgi:hypothetical protein